MHLARLGLHAALPSASRTSGIVQPGRRHLASSLALNHAAELLPQRVRGQLDLIVMRRSLLLEPLEFHRYRRRLIQQILQLLLQSNLLRIHARNSSTLRNRLLKHPPHALYQTNRQFSY
jgi:hypothetical protein